MRRYILVLIVIVMGAACSGPGHVITDHVTARPDPTAATSGTIGSSKATDGLIPFQPRALPDSSRKRQ